LLYLHNFTVLNS